MCRRALGKHCVVQIVYRGSLGTIALSCFSRGERARAALSWGNKVVLGERGPSTWGWEGGQALCREAVQVFKNAICRDVP